MPALPRSCHVLDRAVLGLGRVILIFRGVSGICHFLMLIAGEVSIQSDRIAVARSMREDIYYEDQSIM
ncbi:hypothetical protein BO83DRAFT_380096 [Aspergillus eucalypticola CBS 122712]|uniref:Uncharacterized protein n=1 Tax=Aspergillus eucalypticola (strain CBS 122712 / IBT 29274) TaxID=1448314 RepID=A0A317V3T3_ASPEC|nr:uncharacterized protein BO83DRAFT_380096 [Aspergillus eucalypticola CBS 122712]PWY68934.1 hypothetical protein BO83DRAFT_380096 [Aspergillus eucalypticola CBS 122712]